jgi:acyl-[acyl carrier protein]--UDP-N-acetylglucosamine O-acyltransferase
VIGDRTEIREFATLNLATEPGATTRVGDDNLLYAFDAAGVTGCSGSRRITS